MGSKSVVWSTAPDLAGFADIDRGHVQMEAAFISAHSDHHLFDRGIPISYQRLCDRSVYTLLFGVPGGWFMGHHPRP